MHCVLKLQCSSKGNKLLFSLLKYPFMTLEDLTKTNFLLEYPAGYSIVDTMSQAEDDNIYGRLWRMV